jgi:hypothetical protein
VTVAGSAAATMPPDVNPVTWLEERLRRAGLSAARVKIKRPKRGEAVLGKVLDKATLGRSRLGKASLGKAVISVEGIPLDQLEALCAAVCGIGR